MSEPIVYRRAAVKYLTPKAFAQHFAISYMTVLRLVERGEITAHRLGHSIRIPHAEVARYTEATRMGPGGAS